MKATQHPGLTAFFIVALLSLFLIFSGRASAAADVHPCAAIEHNLGVLYDRVDGTPDGASVEPVAVAVSNSELPEKQKDILLRGLVLLVQNWGHPQLTRATFVQAGVEYCAVKYGPVTDRNHI